MALRLGVVVPCYNEQEVLVETATRLRRSLDDMAAVGLISADSAIYFIDDGSTDRTWAIIADLAESVPRIHGIKLSRNRGHQNALLAGLLGAAGDALVSIDADLQDDLSVIPDMVRKHLAGAEIVYGVRKSRDSDTRFKRGTARAYYWLLSLMGVCIVPDHADFRLMGRQALDCLGSYSEVNLFLRGIVPLVGFSTDSVYYDRQARFAGTTKYPLGRMLALAFDGITSFSVVPLRFISVVGLFVCIFSAVMILWIFYGKLVLDSALPGWASSVVAVYFLGGVQLLSIGMIGEYVAKIYLETKRRPRYFIEKVI